MPLNATSTCGAPDASGTYICSTQYASGTIAINGFTYGEIVSSVFLFLILMTGMVVAFHLMFRRTKIKN